jgi:hypothetical protein
MKLLHSKKLFNDNLSFFDTKYHSLSDKIIFCRLNKVVECSDKKKNFWSVYLRKKLSIKFINYNLFDK